MATTYDPRDDHYDVLGIKPPTTTQAVQDALARQLAKLPPGDGPHVLRRKRLERAAAELSDVVKRAEYDKARAQAQKDGTAGAKITAYQKASAAGIALAEERLEQAPDDLDAMEWLAFQYYSAGQMDRAIDAYVKYLARRPENGNAHYYLARAYQRSDKLKDAARHWQRVVELEPDTDQGQKARDCLAEAKAKGAF